MNSVMFISNRLGGGGSERVLVTLANEIHQKGYKVIILSLNNSEYAYDNDVPVICENTKFGRKPISILDRILKIRKHIKLHRPDTAIAFEYFVGMYTILATRGLKCKVIISERNDPNKLNTKMFMKYLRNMLYGKCDLLVCQTIDAKNHFPKYVQDKAVVIPNPIKSGLPLRFSGIRKKKIVNFCRLEPQKNLYLLIDAFQLVLREHPSYTLSIYGEGSERTRLEQYIKRKKLDNKVFLKGFRENIHELIYDSAMFVSSSDYEGLSNSMLEAMAMGLPTISTDCPSGGARMVIVNNVNGILTPVGDRQSLYEAIQRIIESQTLSTTLSINAAMISDDLSSEKICQKWLEII